MPFPDSPEDIAISRSIEACDNVVVFLSPQAIRHALCLQGLLFALSMNKRIISILLEPVDQDQLPIPLQKLPQIDFQTVVAPLGQTQAGQQLLQILVHEATYHRAHTLLLVQSLQWERQQRNPCLLMRGECLRQYQEWLATAKCHPQYPPIRLQALFLEACQGDVEPAGLKVHLIYGPGDIPYTRQLSELLQLFGQCTSFDHLIRLLQGNLRQFHREAIEQVHYCGCILSPEALDHEAFLDELDYARSLHKPLFIIHTAAAASIPLPNELMSYPQFVWPDLEQVSVRAFGKLFRLLEHNRTLVTYHTQLLQRALQWDRQQHNPKLLLQRHQLNEALAWLQSRPNPTPTPLQRSYIEASRGHRSWL